MKKLANPKYSKHWPYTVAHTIDCVYRILNHGFNRGFFLSLFKLIHCPINWIVCRLAYLNFIFDFKAVLELPKTVGSAQTHKSISFIWIVWSTLYVYLCQNHKFSNKNNYFPEWRPTSKEFFLDGFSLSFLGRKWYFWVQIPFWG